MMNNRKKRDGLGGADVLTSKYAIISPSTRPDADVDYTFGQRVEIDEELLALPEYVAHLLKAEQVARLAGCKLIAIVYGNTVGGFIGFGMGVDRVVSVPGGNTSAIRARWRIFCMSSSCEACVRRTPASIARCAANALAEELETYPKPGLVSFIDQGSHPDMGAHCFLASITAIEPYFAEMARAGATGCSLLDLRGADLPQSSRLRRSVANAK